MRREDCNQSDSYRQRAVAGRKKRRDGDEEEKEVARKKWREGGVQAWEGNCADDSVLLSKTAPNLTYLFERNSAQ